MFCLCKLNILKGAILIKELPGLPSGVKFDPNEQEILEHLEAKVKCDVRKLHPLIDQFIPTLEGENGICYTHPEKLPGISFCLIFRIFWYSSISLIIVRFHLEIQ